MRKYVIIGYISAALSLLIMPEIFGSIAIIIGAYLRGRERASRVLILGITCLFVGLFFTSLFALIALLLPS